MKTKIYFLSDSDCEVVVLPKAEDLPAQGDYYVVAKDGFYLHKESSLLEAFVKINTISISEKLALKAKLKTPLIPGLVIAQALAFFRKVYELFRSEAILLLSYSEKQELFFLEAPCQAVDYARISYEPVAMQEGFKLIGTIHSHADFSAFHSATDLQDEKNLDGIHITLGNVNNSDYFSASCEIAVNDNRFPEQLDVIADGVVKSKLQSKQDVELEELWQEFKIQQDFYCLTDDVLNCTFPEEWLKMVRKFNSKKKLS